MSRIWNEAELKRPPLITKSVSNANFVVVLHRLLAKIIQSEHEENTQFAFTAALLSRLITRRKNSFRRMIGFRALFKLNTAAARLLRVDLQRDLESFLSILPDMVFGKNEIAALPIRDCLDFVLFRLLTVYYIHERIQDCTRDAAEYFAELMRANNFFDTNVILISVLAKLRSLNVILGNRCAKIFNTLVGYRELFPLGKHNTTFSTDFEMPLKLMPFSSQQSAEEAIVYETKVKKHNIMASKKKTSKKYTDIGVEIERK